MLITAPKGANERLEVRVEIQLQGAGEHAEAARAWLLDRYSHTDPTVGLTPGLTFTLTLPDGPPGGTVAAQLAAAADPLLLALDVLHECFTALGVQDVRVLSLHATG